MNAKKYFGLLAMLVLMLTAYAAEVGAAGPKQINACTTITQPGSYVLTRNLHAIGNCLVVLADLVTINLHGFVIQGNATGEGITDTGAAARTSITVLNGTITNFFNGINLGASTDVVIERVNVIGNTNMGMVAVSAIVRNSVASHNGNTGINAGPRSLVTGNTSTSNVNGITAGLGSTVIGNTVGLSSNVGLVAFEGSTVANNTSRNNASFGIRVDCPSLVLGNTATANGTNLSFNGAGCTSDHNVAP